jgi:hypothetical protein
MSSDTITAAAMARRRVPRAPAGYAARSVIEGQLTSHHRFTPWLSQPRKADQLYHFAELNYLR